MNQQSNHQQSNHQQINNLCKNIEIGHAHEIAVTGFPLMLSGFNGRYKLECSDSNKLIYRRCHNSMLFGMIELLPSFFVKRHIDLKWRFRCPQSNITLFQNEIMGVFNTYAMGTYTGSHATISVEPVINKPSLIAKAAFPFPTYPTKFSLSEHPIINKKDFKMLSTVSYGRIPSYYQSYCGNHKRNYVILYSHGNGEDLFQCLPLLKKMSDQLQCDVMAYDYVGYSTSQFTGQCPSEDGCYESIQSALRELRVVHKIPLNKIVIYGRSIGTGPSIYLASREHLNGKFAGVILESPMLSGIKAALGPTTSASILRPFDLFKSDGRVGKIDNKVAIMHGAYDQVISVNHSEQLFDKLNDPYELKIFEKDEKTGGPIGHNNMPFLQCMKFIREFLDSLLI